MRYNRFSALRLYLLFLRQPVAVTALHLEWHAVHDFPHEAGKFGISFQPEFRSGRSRIGG